MTLPAIDLRQDIGPAHRQDIVRSSDDPFAEQVAANKLLVVPGGAHDHGGRPAREANLQRCFQGHIVHASVAGAAAAEELDRIRGCFVDSLCVHFCLVNRAVDLDVNGLCFR